MGVRVVRGLALLFFLAFTLAVTWPGVLVANRARPLVLGLPFVLAWIAAWIVAAVVVLALLHAVEPGDRADDGRRADAGPRERP